MAKKAVKKVMESAKKKAPAKDSGSRKEKTIPRQADVQEGGAILHGKEQSPGMMDRIKGLFGSHKATPEEDMMSYQAKKDKELADMRGAQGDYENSLKPGMLSQAGSKIKDLVSSNPGAVSDVSRLGAGALSYYLGNKEKEKSQAMLDEQKQRLMDAQAQQVGPSATTGIKNNDEAMAARSKALKSISERADMGLTPEDTAQLNQLRRTNAQQLQGQNALAMEDRARRGVGGGGDELAARLMNNQMAANNQSQEQDRQAAMAFQNKMAAAGQLGSMGELQQAGDFNRQMQQGTQQDALAQFNANQRADTQQNKLQGLAGVTGANVGRQDEKAANLAGLVNTVGATVGNRIDANEQQKRQDALAKQQAQPKV